MKKLAALLPFLTPILLTACGGGGSNNTQSAQSVDSSTSTQTTLAANFYGYYRNSGTEPCGIEQMFDTEFKSTVSAPSRPDSLIVDANNVAYRVCGKQLWVGPIKGTLTKTSSSSNAPASGTGSATFTVYTSGAAATGTNTNSGSMLGSSDGTQINSMNFANRNTTGGAALNVARIGATGSITRSYSTLAGTFKQEDFYILFTSPASGTLTVGNDGSFSGSSQSGKFSGQITNFDSTLGIHSIQANVTLNTGAVVSMHGVMAPTETVVENGGTASFPSVVIAMAGNNVGYVASYKKNP